MLVINATEVRHITDMLERGESITDDAPDMKAYFEEIRTYSLVIVWHNMQDSFIKIVARAMLTRAVRKSEEVIDQGTDALLELIKSKCIIPSEVYSMIAWLLVTNREDNLVQLHMMELLEVVLKKGKCHCEDEAHTPFDHLTKDILDFIHKDMLLGPIKDCVGRINQLMNAQKSQDDEGRDDEGQGSAKRART